MSEHGNESDPGEPERVVVRDRRRIDPLTGEVRLGRTADGSMPSAAEAGASPPDPTDPADLPVEAAADEQKLAELTAQLDERTADLQRVSAEYANYRRRMDRDREANLLAARAQLVAELLPVLDDLDRAAAHGDLTGPFKSVADKIVGVLTNAGLTAFGIEGEPFDPTIHEAVQHSTSAEVTGPTVSLVMRKGFRVGERLLRPAMVAVTDAEPGAESEINAAPHEQG